MAQNFKIYIGSMGTKTGIWNRTFPLPGISDCTVAQIYDTLAVIKGVLGFGLSTIYVNQSGELNFFVGKIELYGGSPWDGVYDGINDLPVAGWTPVTAFVSCIISGPIISASLSSLSDGVSSSFGSQFKYTFDEVPSAFHLLTDEIKLNLTVMYQNLINAPYTFVSDFYTIGTYEVQSWTTTITSDKTPNTFLNDPEPIDPVVVESDPDDPNAVDFTQLDSTHPITLAWELENEFILIPAIITMTTIYLEFIIDVYLLRLIRARGKVDVDVMLNGGTQFSGQVKAGTISILFYDGTGVYKIIPNKRSDSIYIEQDVTKIMKIPDPFIKTAYLGT